MTAAAEAAGFSVTGAGCLADIERWPAGDIVVTDSRYFSTWWKRVGATHVLVLANVAGDGIDACSRGARAWIPRLCSPEALVSVLRSLDEEAVV
jgi:hypothetical protein